MVKGGVRTFVFDSKKNLVFVTGEYKTTRQSLIRVSDILKKDYRVNIGIQRLYGALNSSHSIEDYYIASELLYKSKCGDLIKLGLTIEQINKTQETLSFYI